VHAERKAVVRVSTTCVIDSRGMHHRPTASAPGLSRLHLASATRIFMLRAPSTSQHRRLLQRVFLFYITHITEGHWPKVSIPIIIIDIIDIIDNIR
jgi:hypothetical protein